MNGLVMGLGAGSTPRPSNRFSTRHRSCIHPHSGATSGQIECAGSRDPSSAYTHALKRHKAHPLAECDRAQMPFGERSEVGRAAPPSSATRNMTTTNARSLFSGAAALAYGASPSDFAGVGPLAAAVIYQAVT